MHKFSGCGWRETHRQHPRAPPRKLIDGRYVHGQTASMLSRPQERMARFMRNETIMSCFSPGFSSTSVHLGNNPWKVHVSFLPIFRVSTSSLHVGTLARWSPLSPWTEVVVSSCPVVVTLLRVTRLRVPSAVVARLLCSVSVLCVVEIVLIVDCWLLSLLNFKDFVNKGLAKERQLEAEKELYVKDGSRKIFGGVFFNVHLRLNSVAASSCSNGFR